MSVFDYETSADKELNGVEVPVSINKDGSIPTFVISSSGNGNKPYAKAFEKATKPYERIGIDAMGDEAAEKLLMDLFVDHVLKGWRNVKRKDGIVVEYSREAAISLFKQVPRLYQHLQQQAASLSLFKEQAQEESAKN